MSDFEERAAMMEFCGGLPRGWAEFLARITTMDKPADYLPERWAIIREDACRVVDKWLPQIARNGWGVDDIKGLIVKLDGREILSIGMAEVEVLTPAGSKTRIYRRPSLGGAIRWDEGRRAA